MNILKSILVFLIIPFYSLLSNRFGFCFFYPTFKGWRVYTKGETFAVPFVRVSALEYFRHFVPTKGGVVFDVGGELGHEAKIFSDMVGSTGHVYTFECFPSHIAKLQQIAAAHPNLHVIEAACWNEATSLEFYTGCTPGSNTAVKDATGHAGQALADLGRQKIIVNADTLDTYWKKLISGGVVDFLKMDIEGAEYEALEGAEEMLRSTKHVVIAAYHIRDNIRTADQVAEMLRRAGFDKVRIEDNYHVYASRNIVS